MVGLAVSQLLMLLIDIRSTLVFDLYSSSTINADNLSINTGSLTHGSSTIINVNNYDAVAIDFENDSQSIINANNLNVTVTRRLRNTAGSLINVTDNFNVTTDDYLRNEASTILANNFNAIVGGQTTEAGFFNENSATIQVDDNFNATLTSSSFNNVNSTIMTSNFNVASNMNFSNRNNEISTNTIIDADNVNITAGDNFENRNIAVNGNVTINAINNVSITAGGNFENLNTESSGSATIAASSLDFTADTITNGGIIQASSILTITATSTADNSFTNTGGVATADIFNLSVAGNFDYATDYLNNGTITIDTLLNGKCINVSVIGKIIRSNTSIP